MPTDDVVGIACVLGAVALFGTNHLPVKLLPTVGDGFFYQWCLCLGIWLVGLAVDLAHVSAAPPSSSCWQSSAARSGAPAISPS